jgi:hypothetical protein
MEIMMAMADIFQKIEDLKNVVRHYCELTKCFEIWGCNLTLTDVPKMCPLWREYQSVKGKVLVTNFYAIVLSALIEIDRDALPTWLSAFPGLRGFYLKMGFVVGLQVWI